MSINQTDNDILFPAIASIQQSLDRAQQSTGRKTGNVIHDQIELLNENWLSDQLAWLLDTNGSHGFRTQFARRFLKRVASLRDNGDYERGETYLSNSGGGQDPSKLRVDNSCVIREFFLSPPLNKKSQASDEEKDYEPARATGACDVVFSDLDGNDNIFVVIENKLFTRNKKNQLQSYWEGVNEKYTNVATKEFVYLTLGADVNKRQQPLNGTPKEVSTWVCMSWIDDVLDILDSLKPDVKTRARRLQSLLAWMKSLRDELLKENEYNLKSNLNILKKGFLFGGASSLVHQIKNLDPDTIPDGVKKSAMIGKWSLGHKSLSDLLEKEFKKTKTTISNTSFPKKKIHLGLQRSLNLVIQGRINKKVITEKVLIPFGVNPSQLFNFIDLAAKDFWSKYSKAESKLLDRVRFMELTDDAPHRQYTKLFEFVHSNKYELVTCLRIANYLHSNDVEESDEG